jgi:hypothetical protein
MPKPIKQRMTLRSELALAMRVAARNIALRSYREIAAREARHIPKTLPERFERGWGKEAAHGRSIMRGLADLPEDEWGPTADALRTLAHVVEHGHDEVSDVSLANRRRRCANEGRRA